MMWTMMIGYVTENAGHADDDDAGDRVDDLLSR